MTDFTEILRNTLDGVNTAYRTARADFDKTIGELDGAIRKISNNNVRVGLAEREKSPERTVLTLIVISEKSKKEAGDYAIPPTGYPVAFGTYIPFGFNEHGYIHNETQLKSHFEAMLKDKSSALVVTIAFMLRDA